MKLSNALRSLGPLVLLVCSNLVSAAALDRSGQSVSPFFEKGNYAELSYVYSKPSLAGKETLFNKNTGSVVGTDYSHGDTAQAYSSTGAAIKLELQDNVRVALLYDQPLGVDYRYQTGTLFKGSSAKVKSQAVTTLVGTTLFPNVWVYGGLAYEDHEAEVSLAGAALTRFGSGYNFRFSDAGVGYVGGMAYEIPEIALRLATTYRSEVKHRTSTVEKNLPTPKGLVANASGHLEYASPQSVNVNFQTGINPTTLFMADLRWVNWSDFRIVTPNAGIELTDYQKDQVSGSIGIGKQLSNDVSGSVRFAYDAGTGLGNTSIFGPYSEAITLVLGGKYRFNDHVNGSLGMAYSYLGDGAVKDDESDVIVAEYHDSYAVSVGGKLGFYF